MSIIPRKYWAGLHRLKIPGTQGQKKLKFQAKLRCMSRPVSEEEMGVIRWWKTCHCWCPKNLLLPRKKAAGCVAERVFPLQTESLASTFRTTEGNIAYIYASICVCARLHVRVCICMCTLVCVLMYMCTSAMYVCMCVCVCMCSCTVCVYVYRHVRMCIHTIQQVREMTISTAALCNSWRTEWSTSCRSGEDKSTLQEVKVAFKRSWRQR